jgi:hypothetical protein
MQRILGYDALQVGLAYLPMTVVMGTMSFRFTGQLNLRFGPQATLVPAMVFIVAALLLLARTPVDASYAIDLLPAMILIGLGFPSRPQAFEPSPCRLMWCRAAAASRPGCEFVIGCGGCAGASP